MLALRLRSHNLRFTRQALSGSVFSPFFYGSGRAGARFLPFSTTGTERQRVLLCKMLLRIPTPHPLDAPATDFGEKVMNIAAFLWYVCTFG